MFNLMTYIKLPLGQVGNPVDLNIETGTEKAIDFIFIYFKVILLPINSFGEFPQMNFNKQNYHNLGFVTRLAITNAGRAVQDFAPMAFDRGLRKKAPPSRFLKLSI